MEKTLRDSGDRVDSADRSAIEAKIAEVRRAAQGEDLNTIRTAVEDLKQASYSMSQRMYGQPAGGPTGAGYDGNGQSGHAQPGGEGEDVVEGEFREV
jgi:molecular chaperone DnaK